MKLNHLMMAAGVAAAALFGASQVTFAEDAAAPAEAAPAEASTTEAAADAAATDVAEVKELTLADGTKVHVKEGQVTVVGADGTETPAPDGEHTLADGTKIKTMGGVIAEEAPAAGEEAPAEAPAEEPAH